MISTILLVGGIAILGGYGEHCTYVVATEGMEALEKEWSDIGVGFSDVVWNNGAVIEVNHSNAENVGR